MRQPQKPLAELQQKRAQSAALHEPEVKSYEYSDMNLLFNEDDPRTDLAIPRLSTLIVYATIQEQRQLKWTRRGQHLPGDSR